MTQARHNSDTEQTALQAYMARARKFPLLNAAQEVELTRIFKAGGPQAIRARDAMVNANLRYVVSVAWKQVRDNVQLEDLVQEGNIGLMKAVEKFDETRGFRFITYARWWVQQAIGRYLDENGHAFRLPARSAQRIMRMNRVIAKLSRDGNQPTDAQVAAEMGLSLEEVHELAEYAKQPISINTPVLEGDAEFGDRLEDTAAVNPEAAAVETDFKARIYASLSKLTDRQRQVIVLRFGLDGNREHTLEEVGEIFSVTRERIRQIEAKALEALRGGGSGKVLKSFL
ncbi:MAG: RNA polymerase sigma factor RpoD/SigA [Cyanobacteria bacterium SZAS LIN-3]|nr:RNA polymerase sigma factor RpoD/SigA [Cyanobacteria bacterium SZAS LIN-3]